MRLVVDTSVLVGELLRATGRQRLGDDRLDLPSSAVGGHFRGCWRVDMLVSGLRPVGWA